MTIGNDQPNNENAIVFYSDPERLYIGNPFLFSKLDLSNIQFQIFCEMVAHIQKGDTEFNTYRLTVKDFANRIGLNTTSVYQVIRTAAKGMMQHIIKISDDNGIDYKERVLVTGADYMKTKGFVDLKFNNDLKPYLLKLDGEFFSAHLEAIRRIRNVTLGKFYWFCVRWINASMPITIEVEKLRVITECEEKYSRYRDFKREILDKGIEVFKEYGKVIYSYEEIREIPKNKKSEVIKLKIYVRRNSPIWDIPEIDFKGTKKNGNVEFDKLTNQIFEILEEWGFELNEVKKLIELYYQKPEHIFDKINYVKNKMKNKAIDNPKSYLLHILEKNPNLISAESIRKANSKNRQKKNKEMEERQQIIQPHIQRLKEIKNEYRMEEYNTLMEFFNNFPELKIELLDNIKNKFSLAYTSWQKSNPMGDIPPNGGMYGLLLAEVQGKYHIFDKIKTKFDKLEKSIQEEIEKL